MLPFIAAGVAGVAAVGTWVTRKWKAWRVSKINPSPLAASNHAAAVDNPASVTASTMAGAPTMVSAAPNPPVVIAHTAGGNPIVAIVPNVPGTNEMSAPLHAATSSAMQSAHDLYDGLCASAIPSPTLVAAFQAAVNADTACTALLDHPLRTDGEFDAATAAMLTVMTGQPFMATAPMNVKDRVQSSGPASFSATGLYAFLRQFGNVNHYGDNFRVTDPQLIALVKQFQHDVNTDPKYPGPSAASGKAMVNPLQVNGQYDPDTAAALSHVTLDFINP